MTNQIPSQIILLIHNDIRKKEGFGFLAHANVLRGHFVADKGQSLLLLGRSVVFFSYLTLNVNF